MSCGSSRSLLFLCGNLQTHRQRVSLFKNHNNKNKQIDRHTLVCVPICLASVLKPCGLSVCLCVCVRVCACVCVRVGARECMRACVHVCACVSFDSYAGLKVKGAEVIPLCLFFFFLFFLFFLFLFSFLDLSAAL